MPRGQRSKGKTTVTFSCTEEMVRKIDRRANRSAWIVSVLQRELQEEARRQFSNFSVEAARI